MKTTNLFCAQEEKKKMSSSPQTTDSNETTTAEEHESMFNKMKKHGLLFTTSMNESFQYIQAFFVGQVSYILSCRRFCYHCRFI